MGVASALELAARGWQVEVVDPGPLPRPEAASTDISKIVRMDYGADELLTAWMEEARQAGADTYLTGEGPHWSYFDAEELRLNVLYAGHYATETMGVKALAEHLEAKYGLPWVFLDHPTGL